MTNVIKYAGNEGANVPNLNRGPSPFLWKDFPTLAFIDDPNLAYMWYDDFMNFGGVVATNVGTYGPGYKSFETTSTSIKQLAGVGGLIRMLTTATDNDELSLEAGYGNGGMFNVVAGTGPKLWYEARVRLNQIVTQDMFVGLGEAGLAVNDGIFSDADALQDKSLMGFRVLAAASSTIKTCLQLNGGGGERTAVSAQTAVASTWYKLGFKVDGTATKKVKWYVNGIEVDSITDDTIAQFPTNINLTPVFNFKNSTTAIGSMDIDWVKVGQLAA